MYVYLRLFLLLILLPTGSPATAAETAPEAAGEVVLTVFWGIGCPHCENQKPFLEELDAAYPELEVRRYEVLRERTHHQRFIAMARQHGIEPGSVPTLFLDGQAWVGDSPQIRREIEAAVDRAIEASQAEAESEAGPNPGITAPFGEEAAHAMDPEEDLDLPLLGRVDLGAQPLMLTTVLIGLIDGLNPCSLWVLTLLLGLVIHSGSRGRIALVGLTFLATTAAIYGAFIAGVFGVLNYILYLTWLQWIVALFALVFGLVNIKDYFWFRTGPSFTIAESQKPGIYQGIRGLMNRNLTGFGLVVATFAMAAGIALIELPCTAGFPVIWSGLVAEREVGATVFLLLLAIYLLAYLLIELAVFFVALFTLRMQRFEEGHGRALKLLGGSVMVALALVLVFDPDLMNDIGGTLGVFLAAIGLAVVVLLIHRRVTPSEWSP